MVTESSLAQSVERGAEMLDTNYPGWYKEIDLKMFKTASTYQCVLGQLARKGLSWQEKTNISSGILWEAWFAETDIFWSEFGFCYTDSYDEWPVLDHYWKREIMRRVLND